MAKENTALKTPVDTRKNAVTFVGEVGLPTHIATAAQESVGRGTSQAQEDNIVPLITVLDLKSPQVNKRDEAYVEGANGGDIWLRASASPIRTGETGIIFQPCYFDVWWLEWRPDRGGLAGRHKECPSDAEETEIKDEKGETKFVMMRSNGNVVEETRHHYGNVISPEGVEPGVIPFKSTGHKVSRGWMTLMNTHRNGQRQTLDSWLRKYRMRTIQETKGANSWFQWRVEEMGSDKEGNDLGWVTKGEMEAGAALYEALMSGEKHAATEESAKDRGDGEDAPF